MYESVFSGTNSLLILSPYRQLFIGRIGKDVSLNVLRPTLIVALEADLLIRDSRHNDVIKTRSALLNVGASVSLDTQNSKVLYLVLDDRGADSYALRQRFSRTLQCASGVENYCDLQNWEQIRDWAGTCLETQETDPNEVLGWLDSWFSDMAIVIDREIDPRVIKVVYLIKEQCHKKVAISDISSKVHLSPTRLAELFKDVTGSSMRAFRLFYRIYMTVYMVAVGTKPADAAIDAGFADYPHFSRKFKEVVGLSPCDAYAGPEFNNTRIYWTDSAVHQLYPPINTHLGSAEFSARP